MLSIFGFKLFGSPGCKLFRVSPLGQTLIYDHAASFTTGSFYDGNTFGSPYAVQFGRYIYHLLPSGVYQYDTVTDINVLLRSFTGYTSQNHYENSGGIYLSFDGTEWYLTCMYVSASTVMRAERYRFLDRTWATSGTFASAADGQNPGFRYFFNNNVFWGAANVFYKYDTLAMTSSTVSGLPGDHRATSLCMHNNNIFMATPSSTTTNFQLYMFVGGAWNQVALVNAGITGINNGAPSRLFSDGTNMYWLVYSSTSGWNCFQVDGMTFAITNISTTVVPAFLRVAGLSASAFKGFHVDSHNDPNNPEIWLTYTSAWATAGSSLAWYQWMGPSMLMQYSGDAGEGGPDYFLSYDWSGGGHYAWTPGEPYAVMEGTPLALSGGKTRVYFRVYESDLLPLDTDVEVQLHYSSDLEPPRELATISNPELAEETPETFSSPGATTWTCPAGVTSVTVECWGAGGGGVIAAPFPPGGGGGGAYSRSTLTVIPGNVYPLTVGAGVAGGDGGQSFFIDAATVMAMGGSQALGHLNSGQPGGQASAGVGEIKFSGGTGGNGANASHNGGGGAGASRTTNGPNGGLNGNGSGGIAVFPGGNGGDANTGGTAPGGGGGSGLVTAGGAGRIVLTYPVPNQGVEVDANTVQIIAGEQRLWSLDWNSTVDGVALGGRVSLAVRAIGI
jgi:hypothetical protein